MPSLPIETPPAYFSRERYVDLLAGIPIALWYLFAIGGTLPQIASIWAHWPSGAGQWRAALNLTVPILNTACFSVFVVVFFLRRLPLARSEGLMPRLVAILAANFSLSMGLLPRVTLSPFMSVLSDAIVIIGTGGSLYVLRYLGPYFSILPQARGLVTHGPYSRIRHPLYLTETVAIFGVMLSYRQPWAALILLFDFLMQLVRMSYEEELLARTFPEYTAYRNRTYRLIPRLY